MIFSLRNILDFCKEESNFNYLYLGNTWVVLFSVFIENNADFWWDLITFRFHQAVAHLTVARFVADAWTASHCPQLPPPRTPLLLLGKIIVTANRKTWSNTVSKNMVLVKISKIKVLLCFGLQLFWREEYNGTKCESIMLFN